MKEDLAVELAFVQRCPASARARVHFVHALETELDSQRSITLRFPPVDVTTHIAELKVAETIFGEIDVALHLSVDELVVPLRH